MTIRKIAACIEYDGANFSGWQLQSGQMTVQQEVQNALSEIANHAVTIHCAGRTDSGVHACGQVVHFGTASERSEQAWVLGTNSKLPNGISVVWASPVADEFHARFSALRRTYRYVLINRRIRPTYLYKKVSWFVDSLDAELMNQAAKLLLGYHDFSAFRSSRCKNKVPQKTIFNIEVKSKHEWIWLDIEADGFLHHMVRNILGTLLIVGKAEKEPAWIKQVLAGRDRTKAGITAPPDGLYFVKVDYPKRYNLPPAPRACRYW